MPGPENSLKAIQPISTRTKIVIVPRPMRKDFRIRFFFDLPYSFSGEAEFVSDLLQGVRLVLSDAEIKHYYVSFSVVEGGEGFDYFIFERVYFQISVGAGLFAVL